MTPATHLRSCSLIISRAMQSNKERHHHAWDEENHVVNLEELLTPRMGSKGRPARGAMATAAWLKWRSSLWKAASALRSVAGWDPGYSILYCWRVFPLSTPVSR